MGPRAIQHAEPRPHPAGVLIGFSRLVSHGLQKAFYVPKPPVIESEKAGCAQLADELVAQRLAARLG